MGREDSGLRPLQPAAFRPFRAQPVIALGDRRNDRHATITTSLCAAWRRR